MKLPDQTYWRKSASTGFLWYVLVAVFGAAVFFSITELNLPLEVWILVSAVTLAGLYLTGRTAYSIVFVAILASVLINQANYSFFSYSSDGTRVAQGAEVRLLTLLRLPLVILAVGVTFARMGNRFRSFLARNWDAVCFAFLPFISAVFAINVLPALQYALWFSFSILSILALLFLMHEHVPRSQWGEHVAWLLLISCVPAVYLGATAVPSYEVGRYLMSAYNDSNFYAYGCSVALVAVLVLERQRGPAATRMLNKTPFWFLVIVGIAAIVPLLLSAKRSPIIAVALAIVVYVIAGKAGRLKERASTWLRPVAIVLSLVAVAWVVVPQATTTVDRFEKAFDPTRNQSIQQRQDVIQRGITMIASENPVFGLGLANGVVAAGGGLHNTLLAILVEMGGLGFILFVIMVGRSLNFFASGCHASLRWNIVLLAIPPALLAFSEYNLLPGQAMFWPIWIAVLLPRLGSRPHRADYSPSSVQPSSRARFGEPRIELYDR